MKNKRGHSNPMFEQYRLMPTPFKEDSKYLYYKDIENRIQKVEKNYIPRKGYVRLKFLETPYRWWRFRSKDAQHAMIPFLISYVFGSFIYFGSNWISEREIIQQEKAKLPEDYTEEKFREYLQINEEIQKKKK